MTQHTAGVSYSEAWDMPVEIRKWWITRKNKDLTEAQRTGTPVPDGRRRPWDPPGGGR